METKVTTVVAEVYCRQWSGRHHPSHAVDESRAHHLHGSADERLGIFVNDRSRYHTAARQRHLDAVHGLSHSHFDGTAGFT
jgi:hypothetical protein